MATKKRSTAAKPKARATKPGAKRLVSLPLVLYPRSAPDAQRVRMLLNQLVDDGLLQLLSFAKAQAFLAEAHDWAGPGYVVVMPSGK